MAAAGPVRDGDDSAVEIDRDGVGVQPLLLEGVGSVICRSCFLMNKNAIITAKNDIAFIMKHCPIPIVAINIPAIAGPAILVTLISIVQRLTAFFISSFPTIS